MELDNASAQPYQAIYKAWLKPGDDARAGPVTDVLDTSGAGRGLGGETTKPPANRHLRRSIVHENQIANSLAVRQMEPGILAYWAKAGALPRDAPEGAKRAGRKAPVRPPSRVAKARPRRVRSRARSTNTSAANASSNDSGDGSPEGPNFRPTLVSALPHVNVIPFPRTGERVNFDAPRGYFNPAEKKFLTDVAEFLAVSANFPFVFDGLANEFGRSLKKLENELGLEIEGEIIRHARGRQ